MIANGCPSSLNKSAYFMNQYGTLEMKYDRDDLKFSRAILEWVIRQRTAAISNVKFLTKHQVTGLLTSPDGSEVTGCKPETVSSPARRKP